MSLPTIPQAEKDVFKIVAVVRQAIESLNGSIAGADGDKGAVTVTSGVYAINDGFVPGISRKVGAVTPHENLICVRVSNSTIDIDADAVELFDSNGISKRFASLNETLDITASGANGLDTGSEAGNTWYYAWAIGKADGTLDGLLSASASSPTLPAGYTFKGLICAARNNGSSNFIPFRQIDRNVQIQATGILSAGAATSYTAVSTAAVAPPMATELFINAYIFTSSGTASCVLNIASHGSGTTATYAVQQINGTVDVFGIGAPFAVQIDQDNSRIMYDVSGTNANGSITAIGYRL